MGAAVALAALARPARAQQAPPKTPAALPARSSQITREKGVVELTVSFRDAVDAEVGKKLASGLPTVFAMRGYVFREGGTEPIALTARSCRVVYDLWDEIYRIELSQPGGRATAVAVNLEGVLRRCCEVKRLPLAAASLLPAGGARWFVAALVEVNPVSQEMLDRIKRWVSRPNGSNAIGPGDSLFGSFVGLFVARIGDADKKIAFRTEATVTPPEPPPGP